MFLGTLFELAKQSVYLLAKFVSVSEHAQWWCEQACSAQTPLG